MRGILHNKESSCRVPKRSLAGAIFVYTLPTKRKGMSVHVYVFPYDWYIGNWQKAKGKGFLHPPVKYNIDRGQVMVSIPSFTMTITMYFIKTTALPRISKPNGRTKTDGRRQLKRIGRNASSSRRLHVGMLV